VGVIVAAVLPSTLGLGATVAALVLALIAGGWAWSRALAPAAGLVVGGDAPSMWRPLRQPAFRRLLGVFLINGIASAVPATLVLFFVQDRLQAPAALEPAFLGSYFLCAALSLPLWLRVVARFGLARTWLAGMGLAWLFLSGPLASGQEMPGPSFSCVRSRGWPWGPIWRCPARCWPA
jgi:hypothetical protein